MFQDAQDSECKHKMEQVAPKWRFRASDGAKFCFPEGPRALRTSIVPPRCPLDTSKTPQNFGSKSKMEVGWHPHGPNRKLIMKIRKSLPMKIRKSLHLYSRYSVGLIFDGSRFDLRKQPSMAFWPISFQQSTYAVSSCAWQA